MGIQTLGRVLDKWTSFIPVVAMGGWDVALQPVVIVPERYLLRVAWLHPRSEERREAIILCENEAIWQRYSIGAWLTLRVEGWSPLLPFVRSVAIVEPSFEGFLSEHEKGQEAQRTRTPHRDRSSYNAWGDTHVRPHQPILVRLYAALCRSLPSSGLLPPFSSPFRP